MFEFSMALFKDEDMTTSLGDGSEIAIGTNIYIRIHFNGPSNLKMIVQDCMATPTGDTSGVKWYLVKNGYDYVVLHTLILHVDLIIHIATS